MSTLLDSYNRYFRDLHPVLRDMARRGIPIDESRRIQLKELIAREGLRVDAEIRALVPAEVLSTKQKGGYKRTPKDLTGLVQIEVAIEKEEKCQCVKATRTTCSVCAGTGIVPIGTIISRWAMPTEFNPNSRPQVIKFIKHMKHPVPKHSKRVDAATNEASETTEMKELERLYAKTRHPIYPLLIQRRQLTKVEGTYVDGWKPSSDGAVHTTYTFQTATWQTSSRSPNVQNGLKHGKTQFQKELASGFNSMQRAQDGRLLINFDFKSFHALTTAHDFNIPSYARLARIDIHSFLTCHYLKLPERIGLYERDDSDMKALFKFLRKGELFEFTRNYKGKRTILAIQFGMWYRKLFQLNREDFEGEWEAKLLWEMVYGLWPELRVGQTAVKAKAAEDKRLVNQYGAIRHFFDVQRWDRKLQKMVSGEQAEQAVAFLPASHAFGHFRDVLLRIRANGWDEKYGLCNQIHDSMVFHCDLDLREECIQNVKAEMERPSTILNYPEMGGAFQVDAEAAWGDSLAECK